MAAILKEIALDSDGDIAITGGVLTMVTGAAAVAQRVQTKLRTFATEWVFDQQIGTAWFGPVLGAKPDLGLIREILSSRILEAQGVNRILSIEMSFDRVSRVLSVTGRVQADNEDDAVDFSSTLETF